MGTFVSHESCPRCGSRDNLGRYSDGSAWCFGCHYREKADRIPVITDKETEKEYQSVTLSDDLCYDFPRHVVEWLARYYVPVEEAIKHGWKYSPKWDQLVFTFTDADGKVACSQARNFRHGAKTKYFNQGSPSEVLPIFRSQFHGEVTTTATVVLVEDAVSAARVASAGPLEGPWCHAMSCLGSYLPVRKLTALKALKYESLVVWLDADKLKEAREIADKAKWIGLGSRVVYTELDPKEYTDMEIQKFLNLK